MNRATVCSGIVYRATRDVTGGSGDVTTQSMVLVPQALWPQAAAPDLSSFYFDAVAKILLPEYSRTMHLVQKIKTNPTAVTRDYIYIQSVRTVKTSNETEK